MTLRRTALFAAGLAGAAAVSGGVWLATGGGGGAGDGGDPAAHTGRFVIECLYSHSAPDDPIVYPGEPGVSHLHDFFGAVTTDASSDYESLLASDTTCRTTQDRAGYWAPALFDGDRQVVPLSSDAYYRAAPGVDPADVEPYPEGLMMISGDADATAAQPTDHVGWSCGSSSHVADTPPECQGSLALHVTFPDCWDGTNVDSPDHRSHVARSGAGGCPSSHPVALPQLEFVVEYPHTGETSGLRLASGSVHTAHADFFNAWEPEKLAGEVRYCIHRDVVCGVPTI